MCGIAGFSSFNKDFKQDQGKWENILEIMGTTIKNRGPDDTGSYISNNVGFFHTRLSIRDIENGKQPIVRKFNETKLSIIFNGEIYNTDELRKDLISKGYNLYSNTDTEIILVGFAHYGVDYVKRLNGIFAIAIWNNSKNKLYLFRDRLGVKPLFYTINNNTLIFGSSINTLLKYPGIEAEIDKNGISEIFGLGPARTPGIGVFKNFNEILPGHYATFSKDGFEEITYWELESKPHTDTHDQTIEKIKYLLIDSVEKQLISDVPICTLLSGGLDSTIVTAISSNYLRREYGKTLDTFSFDFKDNSKHFKPSTFQPDQDRPWVEKAVKILKTNHTYLECTNEDLVNYLYKAVDAKGLPGMGDIESSLLFFCEKISKTHKVALSGECADEIFGGYPWFHKKDMLEAETFPWSRDIDARKLLLNADVLKSINLEGYVNKRYSESINSVPTLHGEEEESKRRREISYLTMQWFMATLLDRMDRTSMYAGLETRVPYADHRIAEYLFNIPWELKNKDGIVKYLLRKSCEGLISDDLLYRKKSPYPKTYNPVYESILSDKLRDIISNKNAPIQNLIDIDKINMVISSPSQYDKPWFGQLMAGPQLMAYIVQLDYWLKKYNIKISI